jgi:hypothetical protein
MIQSKISKECNKIAACPDPSNRRRLFVPRHDTFNRLFLNARTLTSSSHPLRLFILVTAMASVFFFSRPAHAVDETVLVKKCGHCHYIGGPAAPINPADKAGLVWIKYFSRHRHPVALQDNISKTEMLSIVQYLQEHAADSDRPIAAAIPK